MPEQLDPKIKSLALAIRQVESGGKYDARGASGEFGAYQFTTPTWNVYSKEVLGSSIPLEQATPAQQNQVAYTKLKQWKDQGYNVGQVASMWNAGEGRPNAYAEGNRGVNDQGVSFDTADYARKVAEAYQIEKGRAAQAPVGPGAYMGEEGQVPPTYGAWFPSQQGDNPLVSGLKATGNLIPSVYGLGKGIFDAVTHPVETVKGLGNTAIGAAEKVFGDANPNDDASMTFDAVAGALKERYGSLEALQNTATNDPFAFGLDLASIFTGGASLVGKGAEAAELASKVGSAVVRPLERAAGDAARTTGKLGEYGVSKVTGLEPSTLRTITGNPEAFTRDAIAVGDAGRVQIAEDVAGALRSRIDDLSETGKGYQSVRDLRAPDLTVSAETTKNVPLGNGQTMVYNLSDAPNEILSLSELRKKVQMMEEGGYPKGQLSGARAELASREALETIPFEVKVPKTWLSSQLKELMGVKVGKDGKITAELSSKVRDPKDLRALEELYRKSQPAFARGKLTAEEYLNFRTELAAIARFDREVSKSAALENLAAVVRGEFNTRFRKQIPGLDKLDADYESQISALEDLQKGFIDKEGNLLPAAVNRIANSVGKGKDLQLEKLETILPGITKRLKVQKAIEDINAASGNKVGTYQKSALEAGGVVAGLTTGNLPLVAGALASAIIATPEVAVPLLRAYGMNKELVTQVVNRLKLGSPVKALPATAAAAEVTRPVEQAVLAPGAEVSQVQTTEEEVTV